MTLNDIKTTVDFTKRSKELAKTPGGQTLLKNITRNYLSRVIDTTEIYDAKSKVSDFGASFTDIVRPNKFSIMFGFESYDGETKDISMEHMIKTVTAPAITTNKMTFKRAGKTIKIPLNQDVADNLELSFYQDVDNRVLNQIVSIINNQNEFGYHNQFNSEFKNISMSIRYHIKMNVGSSLTTSVTDLALNFFDIELGYKNSGNNEPRDLVGRSTIHDKIIDIRFNKLFIDNMSGLGDMDMERIDTYSEVKLSIGFNGVEMRMWDLKDLQESYSSQTNLMDVGKEDEQIVNF